MSASSTLFTNASVFDGVTPHLRDGMSVLVEGDRIKEVSDTPIEAAGATRIDLAGRTLMPGLIDCHFHAIAAHPDIRAIDEMPRAVLYGHARLFLEAALQRGFTTVRDAGGADYGLARACDMGLIDGPRLFFAGRALTQTGGHGDFRSLEQTAPVVCSCCRGASLAQIADGVDSVRRRAREELRSGATQIKIMASGGVASPSDPIWNLQYSEDEIRAAVWEAKSWRRYVMAHAYTAEAITRCVEYGVRTIEHANLIDEAAAKAVADHGAYVVPTLVTYDALAEFGAGMGLPQASVEKIEIVRGEGLKSLEILKRAGVKMGLGTDLLGDMHRHQSRELSIRAEVLSPAEILVQATSLGAEILQREGDLGVVAAGALADLLVIDGNPLDSINVLEHQGRSIAAILKGGAFVKNTLH
ncbi:MAG: amidohydrolase family protein [Inquilinaceae bacterium]